MKYLLKYFLIASVIISNLLSQVAFAQQEERVPYSVKAILPENQKDLKVSYFDLIVTPGERQTLKVEVFNSSNKEISVNISSHIGATNQNGIITYDGTIEEYDETLKHPFDKISDVVNKKLTIPAFKSEIATINIDIPEEGFDGQILGGIHFLMDKKDNDLDGGIGFVNEYAYVIGVNLEQIQVEDLDKDKDIELIEKLNKLENDKVKEIEPVIKLNSVEPKLHNHRTSVVAKFSNKSPVLVSGLDFKGWITKKGNDDILYSRSIEKFSIGPNNLFEFPIDLENDPLREGEYTFYAEAKNKDYNFELNMDFRIGDEAKELNNQAIEIDRGINWILVVFFLLMLIIVLLIIYFYVKNKKKNTKEK